MTRLEELINTIKRVSEDCKGDLFDEVESLGYDKDEVLKAWAVLFLRYKEEAKWESKIWQI